jgi:NADP-dependent aldehyde dehydrogenase
MHAAVRAARIAMRDPRLREDRRRAALLEAAAGALDARADELKAFFVAETGLTAQRASTELMRTCDQLEAFATAVARGDFLGAVIDTARPAQPDIRRMLVPIGPVAIFGASNFPLAFGVAGGDTASALAAGCPVIAKGHPSQPGVNDVVSACMRDAVGAAGLPSGTFAAIQEAGTGLGQALVDHSEVAAVAFTGSVAAGRALFDRAAARTQPIPVFAEMGSVNPVVVTEAALATCAKVIADGLVASVTGGAGQLCTKPGLVLVPDGAAGDAFSRDVAARLATVEPLAMLNERLRDALTTRLSEVRGIEGVRLLTPEPAAAGPGFCHAAVAFEVDCRLIEAEPGLRDECFGPAVVIARWADKDDVVSVLQGLGGQLAAGIHADPCADLTLLEALLPTLRELAGRLVFDGFPTGVPVTWATQHGGPYPATTAPWSTSVGMAAANRFLRPVCWQSAPQSLLPAPLRDQNPLQIWRRVNGELTPRAVTGGVT